MPAAASSIGYSCAEASASAASESALTPNASTRRAPTRSTTKPASAWPTPETTKNTVIAAPTCVNDRPKSRMSHGNSGGITKWKKCEVPCAKPTAEITAASLFRLCRGAAAEAADIAAFYRAHTRRAVERDARSGR
jgi:hypothetical protein